MGTLPHANTKSAHVEEAAEENRNPDVVGYTASAETPDFHFRRIGTTSAATEYAQRKKQACFTSIQHGHSQPPSSRNEAAENAAQHEGNFGLAALQSVNAEDTARQAHKSPGQQP